MAVKQERMLGTHNVHAVRIIEVTIVAFVAFASKIVHANMTFVASEVFAVAKLGTGQIAS